jgi:TRAP-type mannitol/chloroaromatic compound transport system permease large subunit
MEFIAANMAPLMFGALVVFMLFGYPVAFALAANGVVFGLIGIELGLLTPALFQALPDRIFGVMSNDTLLAIPFFTFMGLILERSGMAEDLLDTIGQLFGPVRGGLAFAVIFVGAILAATTGVVAASVISMGLISLPIMMRYGYDQRIATGVIAASGTLAQIIPPSLVLIIMADQLGRSVGDMYQGALIPGLVLTAFYVGYVALIAIFKPERVPALPSRRARCGRQAGAAGDHQPAAAAAADLPGAGHDLPGHRDADRRRCDGCFWCAGAGDDAPPHRHDAAQAGDGEHCAADHLRGDDPDRCAGLLAHVLRRRGPPVGRASAERPARGEVGFLIVVNILIFLLAFFLDFFELAFIVVPLLAPAAEKLGIDLIWFGVLLGVNMQTSFMHPPFGFALFYLRSVAPASIKTTQIYWGAVPFVIIQIIMVGVLIAFPSWSRWVSTSRLRWIPTPRSSCRAAMCPRTRTPRCSSTRRRRRARAGQPGCDPRPAPTTMPPRRSRRPCRAATRSSR